jgi:hypothetical protein
MDVVSQDCKLRKISVNSTKSDSRGTRQWKQNIMTIARLQFSIANQKEKVENIKTWSLYTNWPYLARTIFSFVTTSKEIKRSKTWAIFQSEGSKKGSSSKNKKTVTRQTTQKQTQSLNGRKNCCII